MSAQVLCVCSQQQGGPVGEQENHGISKGAGMKAGVPDRGTVSVLRGAMNVMCLCIQRVLYVCPYQ